MQVAVIGTSHLAALKMAVVDGEYQSSEYELEFWGQPRRFFEKIALVNGSLDLPYAKLAREITGGQTTKLPLGKMGAVLFQDGPSSPRRIFNSIAAARCNPFDFSTAFWQAALEDWKQIDPTFALAFQIRREFAFPILISPAPLPIKISGPGSRLEPEEVRNCMELVEKKVAEFWRSAGFIYVPQPAHTIEQGLVTRKKYGVGAVRMKSLSTQQNENDTAHMNSKYGRAVLENAFRVLTQKSVQKCPTG